MVSADPPVMGTHLHARPPAGLELLHSIRIFHLPTPDRSRQRPHRRCRSCGGARRTRLSLIAHCDIKAQSMHFKTAAQFVRFIPILYDKLVRPPIASANVGVGRPDAANDPRHTITIEDPYHGKRPIL